MATYISLMRYTREGITKIKESPARLDKAKQLVKAAGGELKGFYLTMGEYDLVTISEAPDDESVAKIMLALGAAGAVSTQTMRAFDEAEYRKIIAGIPSF